MAPQKPSEKEDEYFIKMETEKLKKLRADLDKKRKEEAKNFLKEIFPKILLFHRYLLTKRDPENSGLATIYHPWESGLDNSLRWDEPLARIEVKDLPDYLRVDKDKVRSDQRPSDKEYDKYVYLIEVMKKCSYDDEKIYDEIPFKVKDIVYNGHDFFMPGLPGGFGIICRIF